MNVVRKSIAVATLLLLVPGAVRASESDQFLAWGIELQDGAPAFNAFLNEHAEKFLRRANARARFARVGPEQIGVEYMEYVFTGLLNSKLRKWFRESGQVEEYPPRATVSVYRYQEMSVYRGRCFPYYLPMSRTVRLGDVYLGTDKVSHMFGFGRRYYKLYLLARSEGMNDEEARLRVIRWGTRMEHTMVGKLMDGVMSYGDLEANYQGMLLCMDLGTGDNPYFVKENGKWRLTRPIDIRDYITPDFDESYNTPHYWLLRKRFVLPIYREEICEQYRSPEVRARFDTYREYEPSFYMKYVKEKMEADPKNPKRLHSLETICAECTDPEAAVLADTATQR